MSGNKKTFTIKEGGAGCANKMTKARIEDIKITARIRKEVGKIHELAADIKRFGLLNPITVMKDEGGELRLLAGLRRLKAAQSIGWVEITINTVTPADAEEALRIEISENEQRESFTFTEQMDYVKLLEEIEVAKGKERMAEGGRKNAGKVRDEGVSKGCAERRNLQPTRSSTTIGEKIGMSGRTYERAKHIRENGTQEVFDRLDSGETSVYKEYMDMRAKDNRKHSVAPVENAEVDDGDSKSESFIDESKNLQSAPRAPSTLSKEDEEAQHKISEFNSLSPKEKINHLQEQLRLERARAANAESELKRERELHHNTKYHSDLSIKNLEGQVAELTAKVTKLTEDFQKDLSKK